MSTLIGIAGAKRSGKSTLADGLSRALGLPEASFAGPIRRFVAEILGITLAELERVKEEPIVWLGYTPRHLMQTVGTEWGRQTIDPELWVRSLLARRPPQGCIVSDVRFDNEAAAILDNGGIVFRLVRPGLAQDDAHASERGVSDHLVTVELVNCSTPDELVKAALAVLEPPIKPTPVSQFTGD